MDTNDGNKIAEIDQTMEFLTASQLVSLRKPDDDPARCVVGEKYYTRSGTWLECKAVESALDNYKNTLQHKKGARKLDLMKAEWKEELNASVTTKLKGKFVQHMGRACDGKIALSPEESIFLLENGCIEILNGKTPMSTEEAYHVMLKGHLSTEKYQVYSQLSQLGFIVVPHQTELGITKYEKSLNLNKHQSIRKRKIITDECGEPKNKRLTFSGAFSNKCEFPVDSIDSTNQETLSISMTDNPVTEVPVAESEMASHPEVSVSAALDKVDNEVKTLDAAATEENKESVIDFLSNAANSALVDEIQVLKEASSSAIDTPITNHHSKETVAEVLFIDVLNEIDTPTYCNKSPESSKEIEVELETVEVGPNDEMSVQQEDADSQSRFDTNSNPLHENYGIEAAPDFSKNAIDVMNIDSENTEISCTSEVSRNNNNTLNSNINVTLEDSSCSVMDDMGLANNGDSNSDVMSCSSDNDDELSVSIRSDCGLNYHSQEDDEIELLEVTKKETKPLAVIDLLSDEESDSELSGSDDDIKVVKVCNGMLSSFKSGPLYNNSYKCKKEERDSPVSASNHRTNFLQVKFPSVMRKEVVCVARPPVKYLPFNSCLSKEAYILNFKPKSEPSQPPNRLWNSYKDMQEYQRARRQNKHNEQSFPSFRSRESSQRPDYLSRDLRYNSNQRRTDVSENTEPNRRTGPPETNLWLDSQSHRDIKQTLSHGRMNLQEGLPNHQNSERNPWLDRNPGGLFRNEPLNLTRSQSMDSNESFPNSHAFNHSTNPLFNSSRMQLRYPPVPNAAAAMNSVVSVSNQDMNLSMVGNHILHPPMHSSSPHLPSFNASLPSLAAIGPVDIMAEVQRTAYTVATNMLSSMFGQNINPHIMPHFNSAFQPVQNSPFRIPSPVSSVFNPQTFGGEQFSMQNQRHLGYPFRNRFYDNPFPCQYRNVRNRSSWNEVKEAIGDDESSLDVGSDVEEVPLSADDILWDPKTISPLLKPGTKYPPSEVLKKLQITQTANLLNSSINTAGFQSAYSVEISFDVYLPGTNYKKTCPDVPKHRIIVAKSTDPMPRFAEISVVQSKWKDGATLQIAVVDNGDISYQSFNSVCLPVLIPHEE